ncbi:hypothetical protein GCM10027203_62550 [Nonomuraea fastidiosa]
MRAEFAGKAWQRGWQVRTGHSPKSRFARDAALQATRTRGQDHAEGGFAREPAAHAANAGRRGGMTAQAAGPHGAHQAAGFGGVFAVDGRPVAWSRTGKRQAGVA